MLNFFLGTPIWQCVLCLTGKEKNPKDLYSGKVIAMRNKRDNPDHTGNQSLQSYQMIVSYYLGDLPNATKVRVQK